MLGGSEECLVLGSILACLDLVTVTFCALSLCLLLCKIDIPFIYYFVFGDVF